MSGRRLTYHESLGIVEEEEVTFDTNSSRRKKKLDSLKKAA